MKVEGGIALFLPSIALAEVLLPTGLRSQMTIASGMLEVRDKLKGSVVVLGCKAKWRASHTRADSAGAESIQCKQVTDGK